MPSIGGARPGAGRKPGTPNRKTVEVLEGALADGVTPVEYMLGVMRDEAADPADRKWAAEKAAPFVHPRPAPLQRTIEVDLPELSSAKDLATVTAAIVRATAAGEISPAEAQQLAGVVEAHRKAVESTELVERIERLEQQANQRRE